ncbi:ribosomal protein S10 domain-containing protein [Russula ochroleuca]|uniref:Ribosomal protein S10 domain-containing protein n=1 Tax=Russula ochroleuca TaxID=152965 RepID=A0A9P5MPV1_9AGAM|nr:ribosomal protein S10 domain-containing protein [Russula ochroleuca]
MNAAMRRHSPRCPTLSRRQFSCIYSSVILSGSLPRGPPKTQAPASETDEPLTRPSTKERGSTSTPKASQAMESFTSPTNPQFTTTTTTTTTVKALRGVRIDPEERDWHAKVVHGRGVLEAYRHPRTYGVPVASIQFRAHRPEPIRLAAHFASHAAASLGIPLSGVASLPRRRTLWTVPRGPFVHKKSQENFERRVHARAIKAFDADAEVVDRWVRYLEMHALPGVGMRVVRWHRLPVGVGSSHLQSVVGRMRLGKPTDKQMVKELGDKIVEAESKAANEAASTPA